MREFIQALPKVELHLHLVGAASPDTVLTLARRHPERGVPTERDALLRFYEFTDFPHFIDVYSLVNRLVSTGEDVTTLVEGIAADLAAAGAPYAEVTVTPLGHLSNRIDPEELAEALTEGRARAARVHGVELAWVYDIPGGMETATGLDTIGWVLRHAPEGSVGFGLGGLEVGVPRAMYRRSFDMAIEAGLRSAPHAGETVGPEEIWSALTELRAERIGHGVSAVQDPLLLRHLADHGIPLEVCPTSNLRTGAVRRLAEHPLPRLLDAGVPVALATDDPGMFHADLVGEYLLCHELFGLGPSELAELARAGVRAAFCGEDTRARLLAGIDAVVAPRR